MDGWWARRFNSVSKVGKMLDPITDRAVLLVGVMAVGIDGSVPWWLVILTLAREGIVAVVGLVLLSLGAKPIDVTWWGKCATFGLYFCFPLLLAGASDLGIAEGFRIGAGCARCPRWCTATSPRSSTYRWAASRCARDGPNGRARREHTPTDHDPQSNPPAGSDGCERNDRSGEWPDRERTS